MALIQTATGNGLSPGSGATLTFSANPTAGNLLVFGIGHDGNPGAYTPPTGWTQLLSTLSSTSGTACYFSYWYRKNCPTTNGLAWSWANVINDSPFVAAEYSLADLTSPNTDSGSQSGNSSVGIGCGNGGTLNQLSVLIAAQATASGTAISFSAADNGYTIQAQFQLGSFSTQVAVVLWDAKPATVSQSHVTSNTSDDWCAIMGTFKDAAVTVPRPSYFFFRDTHPAEVLE